MSSRDRDPRDGDAPEPPAPDARQREAVAPDAGRDVAGELLALLDPDPRVAAEHFQDLRDHVSRCYEWMRRDRAYDAEDIAAEAIRRALTHALEGRVDPRDAGFRKYVFGVARLVAKEPARHERREQPLEPAALAARSQEARQHDAVERSLLLEQSLRQLPSSERTLLEQYYAADDRAALAAARGLSAGALRVTVHRLIKKVRRRLQRKHDPARPSAAERRPPDPPKKA